MNVERFFRQALQRSGNEPKLVGILSWLVVRLSGLLLLGLALFHLMYMHFIAPGGVAHQNYQAIATRWTDPPGASPGGCSIYCLWAGPDPRLHRPGQNCHHPAGQGSLAAGMVDPAGAGNLDYFQLPGLSR
jgi:hypothetical protein